jgi:hypothetical protein
VDKTADEWQNDIIENCVFLKKLNSKVFKTKLFRSFHAYTALGQTLKLEIVKK